MINIKRILKDNRTSKALLGMTISEFDALVKRFEVAWYIVRKNRPNRKRSVGGGQRGKLPTSADKLAFVLMYLKIYPTFDVLAVLTDRSRGKCCESIQKFLPVLEQTLGHACVLPARKISSVSAFFQVFPVAKDSFIDGAERPIERPQKASRRRKLYSGKKKRCTRKTIVVVTENKWIGVMTPTKSGRRHDKRLADKVGLFHDIPSDVTVWADTGFQGVAHLHPNTMIPHKAKKNRPLSQEEKQYNRLVSSFRCVVEHAIGGYKRFKAASDIYRNRRPNLDDQFHRLSAGLWNFHLQQRQTLPQ
jgi:hypothetical protein